MERRETSTAIHPDQVLAKCANGQMETRLAVLLLWLTAEEELGARIQEPGGATLRSRNRPLPSPARVAPE
jgi:hypothetical protein